MKIRQNTKLVFLNILPTKLCHNTNGISRNSTPQHISRLFRIKNIVLYLLSSLDTASAKVDLKTKKLPRCRPCPHENLGNFQCNMWFWKNFSGKNQGFWFFENSDKVLLKLIQKLYIEIFHIQDGAFFKTDETVYLWM